MRWVTGVGGAVLPFAVVAIAAGGASGLRAAAVVLVLLPLGAWALLRAPGAVYALFGLVLGAVPFATLPGVPAPLVLLLGALVGLAAVLHAPAEAPGRTSALEWATILLIAVSAASMLANLTSGYDVSEFVKWLLATSVLLSLGRLPRHRMRTLGRAFVLGSAAAAVFALVLLVIDPDGTRLSLLSFLGYGTGDSTNLRYVVGSAGEAVRLTGTWVDPNVAGLFLFVAVTLALTTFRGVPRVLLAILLAAAMALTLSRSALFSAGVALIVALLVQRMRIGRRVGLFALLAAAGGAVLAVPVVQDRLFDSFGQYDRGTSDRLDALARFSGLLDGHWLFGLGWGRIEFRDEHATAAVNFVANAPLLTVYRGGVVDGLVFVAVIVAGLVQAFRGLRRGDGAQGVVGAAFVGFAVVALQVDFPVVTIAPVTALYALLLAALPRPGEIAAAVALGSPPVSRVAARPAVRTAAHA